MAQYTEQVKGILNELYELDIKTGDELDIKHHSVTQENVDKQVDSVHDIWIELNDCVSKLEMVDYKIAKEYVGLFCEDEKNDLIKQFKIDFENIPRDNALRIETLAFMGKIGIIIHD